MDRDREMAVIEELMRLDRMPGFEQLKWGDVNLLNMLHAPESINAWEVNVGSEYEIGPGVGTNR